MWDHSIQNVNPCINPKGCINNNQYEDLDDLLDFQSFATPPDYAEWQQATYFVQTFPDRQGINVVQNATLPMGAKGVTLGLPLAQSPNFSHTMGSNIIVLPNNTTKVLGHEVGHALGLTHVSIPLNLMCGASSDSNFIVQFIDNLWCFEWSATSLNEDQLNTAKARAATLVE